MNFPIAASCGVSLRYASHTSWFGFTQQHPFGSCFYRSQQAAGYVSHRIKINEKFTARTIPSKLRSFTSSLPPTKQAHAFLLIHTPLSRDIVLSLSIPFKFGTIVFHYLLKLRSLLKPSYRGSYPFHRPLRPPIN